jgi:two-component system sensor histidine kinase KdpD
MTDSQLNAKNYLRRRWLSLLLASLGVLLVTGLIQLYHLDQSFANVSMLYLLVVTFSALLLGRVAAVAASVLSFLAFNWFFVTPRYRFTVLDSAEWLALCVFLLTAIVIGQLTALLRMRVEEANRSKSEAIALAQATWSIASQLNRNQALQQVLEQLVAAARLPSAAIISLAELENPQVVASYIAESRHADAAAVDRHDSLARHIRAIDWARTDKGSLNLEQGKLLPITVDGQAAAVLYLETGIAAADSATQQPIIEALINHAVLIFQRDALMKADARAQALAEADRLKTALLSMISHDFKSPLTSIKTSVGSLLHDSEHPHSNGERQLLNTVDHETDRLNRMVGNILDLSRLEAGVWKPRCDMIPVTELVGAALDAFSLEDNRRILLDINCSPPSVWVDAVQIVQVLTNLIENALKYAPHSTVELKSYVEADTTVIEVLDNGQGLPVGQEHRIFEAFYRSADLSEGAIPGIGIGLAICRGLVQAHGGQLTAKNRASGGAAFRLVLQNVDNNQEATANNENPGN